MKSIQNPGWKNLMKINPFKEQDVVARIILK
jgi:hypothetical protein